MMTRSKANRKWRLTWKKRYWVQEKNKNGENKKKSINNN